jgi:hypothetical protein
LVRRSESADARIPIAEIPKGGRVAAAAFLFAIRPGGATRESARADSDRAKIPEGGRFAAAALRT